jgi:hypothetical protein
VCVHGCSEHLLNSPAGTAADTRHNQIVKPQQQ